MYSTQFAAAFQALTDNPPFPWQRRLYEEFVAGTFPTSCNMPTGLGKTAVIPIWLLALANAPTTVPRRLVYVVNRRTVVDQATREAEKLRENLRLVSGLEEWLKKLSALAVDPPLAISTLRGQFADNGEWRADPARPAVIVGTVDMVGSRLLFSGYGCGFKSKPLHAGFLGQDVLLVHDEAHLEPAFQKLLTDIVEEQKRCGDFRYMQVIELTATTRGGGEPFALSDEDRANEVVTRRVGATKRLVLHEEDEKKIADRVAELALKHKESKRAVLVFLRKLEDVQKVYDKLSKTKAKVERLTGTLRGRERDGLATRNPVFARFLPPGDRRCQATEDVTVYLVCTSAGEVGVNLSADHLVCDLTPFDSMAQRFGRVNRFGDRDDTRIEVVHPKAFDENDEYDLRRERTLKLLVSLNGDGSPAALGTLPPQERAEAFSPQPFTLSTTDILFDAWALTSVREPLPGRPPVADFLHGISGQEPPETSIAWREEVRRLRREDFTTRQLEEFLDDYPLKPHELLRDRTYRVFEELEAVAARDDESSAWVIDPSGGVKVYSLTELVAKDKQKKPLNSLSHCTVLLPPEAGGLEGGMLDGARPFVEDRRSDYDIADAWDEELPDETRRQRRKRVWDDDEVPRGMRPVRVIDTNPDGDNEDAVNGRRFWRWCVRPRSADDDGSQSSTDPQNLDYHQTEAKKYATQLADALRLGEPERSAVIVAAWHHDDGKHRPQWQVSIGNANYPAVVLAKSGNRRPPEIPLSYRHEFGSLLDVVAASEFKELSTDGQDLALHLIAAHHGRARPHFTAGEASDTRHGSETAAIAAEDGARRFGRLQREYGRWGLAYLESLVRAADILASRQKGERDEQP